MVHYHDARFSLFSMLIEATFLGKLKDNVLFITAQRGGPLINTHSHPLQFLSVIRYNGDSMTFSTQKC